FGVLLRCVFYVFYFFFQAEDGIRDGHVTGVQTCALPISLSTSRSRFSASFLHMMLATMRGRDGTVPVTSRSAYSFLSAGQISARSEERRVGKECRSRRSTDH